MTALTAIQIGGAEEDEIIVTHGGPDKNGKYAGWITLGVEDYCRPLVSTAAVFNSPEEADAHMQLVLQAARNWYDSEINKEAQ